MTKRCLSFIISMSLLAITIIPAYSSTLPNAALFNWVEYKYASLFPKHLATKTDLTHEGVHYDLRHWSGAWGTRYLGIMDDGEIVGLGDYTDGLLKSFGYIDEWEDAIIADNHNNPVRQTITLSDPYEYYSHACENPSSLFVIPVNINDDNMSDFIVHYWCNADHGGELTGPTPDALVVQVSQPDGTYTVANNEVFGNGFYGLGGATRKYVRDDINGDGRDDFAFAMNWEDGRYNEDSLLCATEPSILMSTGSTGYEVVRLGLPSWGHAVGVVNNADGTKEVVFAGFSLNSLQAFRYENGEFTDVSALYPADAGQWATAFETVEINDVTEYIAASATVTDPNASEYTLLQSGLKFYKRDGGVGWTDIHGYMYDVDFTVDWTSWSYVEGTIPVFTINGEKYFGAAFSMIETMSPLTENGGPLIVAKLGAAADAYGRAVIEGEHYSELESTPVNIYQFFEFSDAGITLINTPVINEEIESNFNFFDAKDITGDGFPDLISYAFTRPGFYERIEEDGKPIIYLNNGSGQLVKTDISYLPGAGLDSETQSHVHDVNSDGIVDLLLFGSTASDINIHILNGYITPN